MSSQDKKRKTQTKTKNERGRPSKYKPEYCDRLIAHMGKPASFESFASQVDVDRDTLYEWRKVHKDFSDAHKKGKMACLNTFEMQLRLIGSGKLKGNIAAVIFHMKNLTTFRDDPIQQDDVYEEMEFVA